MGKWERWNRSQTKLGKFWRWNWRRAKLSNTNRDQVHEWNWWGDRHSGDWRRRSNTWIQKSNSVSKTHRRMKWRLAMRIPSLPVERWAVKPADGNLDFSTKYKKFGKAQKRRWEDEINEFFKPEETETTTRNDKRYNSAGIKVTST